MMLRWILRLAVAAALIASAIVVGGAISATSRLPDLQPWHTLQSTRELRASEIGASSSLDDYVRREEAVFREVHDLVEVPVSAGADASIPNRYVLSSRSSPSRFDTDWNRTQSIDVPDPIGGVLLVHGLTDSPYSMRAIAAHFHDRGFYTLNLRMQGHGTVPGGLVEPVWEDWLAAIKMGARHVRARIGAGKPLVLVGYSNGGALLTKYALDTIDDASLPAPARLILISPMIGVSPAAFLARTISRLGPMVPKARWLDVYPEYNPFKYVSFPANAGYQTSRLTGALDDQIARMSADHRIDRLPPVLAFQSVVDTTVSTPAVIYDLFDRLSGKGHALVLFDLNRAAAIDALTKPDAVLPRLLEKQRPYGVTLITNTSAGSLDVSAMTVEAGADAITTAPLNLSWPAEIFSLSHVALPFAEDDPLFGGKGNGREMGSISLGRIAPRGEKNVLVVPIDSLMRVTWNPFFSYLLERIDRATSF